jgi:hypothetical protein
VLDARGEAPGARRSVEDGIDRICVKSGCRLWDVGGRRAG